MPERPATSRSCNPLVAACVAAFLIAASGFAQTAKPSEKARYQAVWVDAFHDGFKTPEQTRALIDWARRYCVNALFVEVRKAGDAYYDSTIEPKAADISPPGYDPLADLIAQAHVARPGQPPIEIHAWLIIYRVGVGLPLPPTHVAQSHPEWLSRTHDGQKSEEGHIFLDPGVPNVVDHTSRVVGDLVSRYALDGIHFDRIRYPGRSWGYNPTAVGRFRSLYGRRGQPAPDDRDWKQFRREQIDAMMRRLYVAAKARRPAIKVSAATIAFDDCPVDFRLSRAYDDVFQDWRTWARQGWLDLNCPMIYKREAVAEQAGQYTRWIGFLAQNRGLALPVVGQGSFLNGPAESVRQISLALQHPQAGGVCLFSYAQLAAEADDGELLAETLRDRLFGRGVAAPSLPTAAQAGYGWVAGYVTARKRDRIRVALSGQPGRETWTDGSGFFAFTRVPAGKYRLSVWVGQREAKGETVEVAAGQLCWRMIAP